MRAYNKEKQAYIGNDFPVPSIPPEGFRSVSYNDHFCKLYFDGGCLPEEVREELYRIGKAEIEYNTRYGTLPDSLISRSLYYLDILFDQKHNVCNARIGTELIVFNGWENIEPKNYCAYIKECHKHLPPDCRNLTRMCAGYSVLDVKITSRDELNKLVRYAEMGKAAYEERLNQEPEEA